MRERETEILSERKGENEVVKRREREREREREWEET